MENTNIRTLSNILSDLNSCTQEASKQLSRISHKAEKDGNMAEYINEYMMNVVRSYNSIAKEYRRLCEENKYEPFWIDEMK